MIPGPQLNHSQTQREQKDSVNSHNTMTVSIHSKPEAPNNKRLKCIQSYSSTRLTQRLRCVHLPCEFLSCVYELFFHNVAHGH
jgi:hypothetical protein